MGNRAWGMDGLSPQATRRLPGYYNYLRDHLASEEEYVSAAAMAREFGLNEVQVRKDLAAVSTTPGVPRKGFLINQLLIDIGEHLGYHNNAEAILVGVGRLGQALLGYHGFGEHGVHISAAFDTDPAIIGAQVANKTVRDLSELPALGRRMDIRIGIIAVPAAGAQDVCDLMLASGIEAIWNFAPVHLRTPPEVLVRNENLPAQLARLSQQLAARQD